MCFVEYMIYGCGHGSEHILRPCALTTHLYNNPVCAVPAERATQLNCNCPACGRILHVRWVEIITLEHQWMHERGVCSCPVQFPALMQPQMIGGPKNQKERRDKVLEQSMQSVKTLNTIEHERSDQLVKGGRIRFCGTSTHTFHASSDNPRVSSTSACPALDSTSIDHRGVDAQATTKKGKNRKKGKGSLKSKTSPKAHRRPGEDQVFIPKPLPGTLPQKPPVLAWNQSTIPAMIEVTDDTDKTPTVAVRQASQYGIEWIVDHRELHCAGRCACRVRFEAYTPQFVVYEDNMPDGDLGWMGRRENMAVLVGRHEPTGERYEQPDTQSCKQTHSRSDIMMGEIAERALGANQSGGMNTWESHPSDAGLMPAAEAEAGPCVSGTGGGFDQHGAVIAGYGVATSPAQQSFWDHTSGFWNPTSSGYPAAAQPCQMFPTSAYPPQPTIFDGIWAARLDPTHRQQQDPLVGYPIGAGPEGCMERSHAPTWDKCELARPKLKRTRSWS